MMSRVRKTLTLHPTSEDIFKLGLLLAATVVAFVIGMVVGGDEGSKNEQQVERASSAPAQSSLSLSDFGLELAVPSEWKGEDRTILGNALRYEKAADWKVSIYIRQEGVQARLGEGPTLIVQVVTADSEAGRAELSTYYKMLSGLKADKPTDVYDLVSNATARMTGAGLGPSDTMVVKSESMVGGAPFASRAYVTMRQDRLYVIAYARSSPSEIAVDEPLIQEIMASFSIAD
jgi:hypothetical protein